jgi:hypothetical protein
MEDWGDCDKKRYGNLRFQAAAKGPRPGLRDEVEQRLGSGSFFRRVRLLDGLGMLRRMVLLLAMEVWKGGSLETLIRLALFKRRWAFVPLRGYPLNKPLLAPP